MLYLTAEELFGYTGGERRKWCRWFVANPQAMRLTAQRDGRFPTIRSLVDHVFLVERRHWQRLTDRTPIIDRTGIGETDVEALFAFGDRTREDLVHYARELRGDAAATVREFDIRGQRVAMTPRKLLLHILIHEVRHCAQVALAVRNAGLEPPGNHDLFYCDALE